MERATSAFSLERSVILRVCEALNASREFMVSGGRLVGCWWERCSVRLEEEAVHMLSLPLSYQVSSPCSFAVDTQCSVDVRVDQTVLMAVEAKPVNRLKGLNLLNKITFLHSLVHLKWLYDIHL